MPEKHIRRNDKKPMGIGREKKPVHESLEEREARITREKRKVKNAMEVKAAKTSRVSYVKKPFARNSLYSIWLAAVGVLLFGLGFYGSVRTQGQAGLNAGALGFSSLLVGIVAIWYGIRAFSEKDKNYILGKIGGGIGLALILVCLIMTILGMRG